MKRLIIPLIIILSFAALIVAQEENEINDLLLSVAGETCALERVDVDPEATPEATPEVTPEPSAATPDWLPDLPTYTLGDDCDDVERLLRVPSNGTLWLALLSEDGDEWLLLETIEDDPYPPQLDGRGRYFGCAIPVEGEQVCYVVVEWSEETVLIAVPLWVGDAYIAPQPTATEEPEAQEQQTGDNPPAQDTGGQPQPTNPPQPTQAPPPPPPPIGGGT